MKSKKIKEALKLIDEIPGLESCLNSGAKNYNHNDIAHFRKQLNTMSLLNNQPNIWLRGIYTLVKYIGMNDPQQIKNKDLIKEKAICTLLVSLAHLAPINEDDICSHETIDAKKAIFMPSGQQHDSDQMLVYLQHGYRKEPGTEIPFTQTTWEYLIEELNDKYLEKTGGHTQENFPNRISWNAYLSAIMAEAKPNFSLSKKILSTYLYMFPITCLIIANEIYQYFYGSKSAKHMASSMGTTLEKIIDTVGAAVLATVSLAYVSGLLAACIVVHNRNKEQCLPHHLLTFKPLENQDLSVAAPRADRHR